ncbi:MAG: hypothetical protein EAY75_05930 [Bacteroidetes bacterium]|nr:MAG: hypothetical protein EAY75_05930 [Bacteroidota bacterium]
MTDVAIAPSNQACTPSVFKSSFAGTTATGFYNPFYAVPNFKQTLPTNGNLNSHQNTPQYLHNRKPLG